MASQNLDQFLSMMTGIATGSLAGKQQAAQEQQARQDQQQQMALHLIPVLQQQQEQQRQTALAPYQALAPHLGMMSPEAQAQFLGQYSTAAGQQPAGVNYGALANAFPANSPLHSLIGGLGSPQQTPQIYYNQPPVSPPPPAPPMPPAGTPVQPPVTAVAGAPGVAPEVASGGGPAGPPTVRAPFGNFSLSGITKDQLTRQASSFERASAPYRRAGLTGEPALAYQRLAAGYNAQPKTAAELQANDQIISQMNANAAVLLSPAQVNAQMGLETKGYAKGYNDLLTGKQSDLGAAVALRSLRHEEKGLTERYGHATDVPLNNLEPYDQEIAQIDGLLSSETPEGVPKEREQMIADRQQAGGIAKDVMANLKNPVSPEDEVKEFSAASKILANLTPKQQQDSNLAANAIQDVAPHLAQRIRENGLKFGGAGADRRFTQLMGQFQEFSKPGTPAAARQVYVDSLIAAGKLAGREIKLTAADIMNTDPLVALKLKQAGLNIQKTQGDIGLQPLQAKEREARLGLIAAQTSEAQARTAKIGRDATKAAAQKGLLTQNAQLRVDTEAEKTALKAYTETVKTNSLDLDPKFDVTKPRPGNKYDAAARQAYDTYVQARQRTQGTLRSMKVNVQDERWNPIAGSRSSAAATPSAAKAPGSSPGMKTITAGGRSWTIDPKTFDAQARSRGMTPEQIRQYHQQFGF